MHSLGMDQCRGRLADLPLTLRRAIGIVEGCLVDARVVDSDGANIFSGAKGSSAVGDLMS